MKTGMNNMNSACKNEDVCWIENTNTKELNIYVGVLLLEKILQLSDATVRIMSEAIKRVYYTERPRSLDPIYKVTYIILHSDLFSHSKTFFYSKLLFKKVL